MRPWGLAGKPNLHLFLYLVFKIEVKILFLETYFPQKQFGFTISFPRIPNAYLFMKSTMLTQCLLNVRH